jgi:carbon monoxide dehydrogenase subunit G
MLVIETPQQNLKATQQEVYGFLADMNNLQKLMPEQVVHWKSDADSCTYTIKGMADIGMRVLERKPFESIHIQSEGKGPFAFTLTLSVKDDGEHSKAGLKFEGDVNPFLKMMVEKPLSNFFNLLIQSLGKQFS